MSCSDIRLPKNEGCKDVQTITGVVIVAKKDMISNGDGTFRVKRKYGKHLREIYRMPWDEFIKMQEAQQKP